MNPKYPIYVISKGRWDAQLTVKSLNRMRVPYSLVVEPQEATYYQLTTDKARILSLPFSDLGKGSIPARNWVWEHAVKRGASRHWIIDDNIDGFFRYNYNLKTPVSDGTIFRAAEDFVDRYDNVAEAGFAYFMFVKRKFKIPPFMLNTRIYSCILLRTDLPHRWRGRYNEDTDLSLRILKDGWCTVEFNAFLALKQTTMSMRGGNTDELYWQDEDFDGRLAMAQSLQRQHPDVVKISRKWDRWQHHVDYSPFAGNQLRLRKGIGVRSGFNNYGMNLQYLVDGEWVTRDETDERTAREIAIDLLRKKKALVDTTKALDKAENRIGVTSRSPS